MRALTRGGRHISTVALRKYPGPWPLAPIVPTGDLVISGGSVTLSATAIVSGVEYGFIPVSGWVWQSADQRCIGLNGLVIGAELVAVSVSGAPVYGTTVGYQRESGPQASASIPIPDTVAPPDPSPPPSPGPSLKQRNGSPIPKSVSFQKAHGPSPTTCEATFLGDLTSSYYPKQRISFRVGGSLWTGQFVDAHLIRDSSEGVVTRIRAMDLRTELADKMVFGQINMIHPITGRVYSYMSSLPQTGLPDVGGAVAYESGKDTQTLIEYLLSLAGWTATYSEAVQAILDQSNVADWQNSKWNVYGLDWSSGARVSNALTQVCEPLGIQFCPRFEQDRTLHFTVIGEEDMGPVTLGVSAANRQETGTASQVDVDTGVWITGERDLYEYTLPLLPDWNRTWDKFSTCAKNQDSLESVLRDMGLDPEIATVEQMGTSYAQDGKLDGKPYSAMLAKDYLANVVFKLYRIQGMSSVLTNTDEYLGNLTPIENPIATPLVTDPTLAYKVMAHWLDDRYAYAPTKWTSNLYWMENGHRLLEATGQVVFDSPRFTLNNSFGPNWRDCVSSYIIPDEPQITLCFKGAQFRQFFGTTDRVGSRHIQGLRHSYVVNGSGARPIPFVLDGDKDPDLLAQEIAQTLLPTEDDMNRKRRLASGSLTFNGTAGHDVGGTVRRVAVSLGSGGVVETVDFANDKPSLTHMPQLELRHRIAVAQTEKRMTQQHNYWTKQRRNEMEKRFRSSDNASTVAEFIALRAAAQDKTTKAVPVVNTGGIVLPAGTAVVVVPNTDANTKTAYPQATKALSSVADGDKGAIGVVGVNGENGVAYAVTHGVAIANVTGPCEPNDALAFKKSGDYGVLTKGSGSGIVALEQITDDSTKAIRVRFGGGSSGSVVFVKAATTESITLSGAQTIDGVPVTDGDKVCVWVQGTSSENGIYTVSSTGAWTRESKFEAASPFIISVMQGTDQGASMLYVRFDDALYGMGAYFY